GQLGIAQIPAPVLNQRGKQPPVLLRCARIGLALIPEDTPESTALKGGDHGVVHPAGLVVDAGETLQRLCAAAHLVLPLPGEIYTLRADFQGIALAFNKPSSAVAHN